MPLRGSRNIELLPQTTNYADDSTLLVRATPISLIGAPLDASGASNAEDLQALIMTVSRLQESLDSLEAKLAERDAELVSLRSALTEQQAAKPVPVVMEAPAAPGPQPIPLWPFLAGLATLLGGAGLLIWRRLRQTLNRNLWAMAI